MPELKTHTRRDALSTVCGAFAQGAFSARIAKPGREPTCNRCRRAAGLPELPAPPAVRTARTSRAGDSAGHPRLHHRTPGPRALQTPVHPKEHMEPTIRDRTRALSGRSAAATAASQNLVRAKRRVPLAGFRLDAAPKPRSHSGPGAFARVSCALRYEGGVLALPAELAAEDAIALGAALIASARDALGEALASAVQGDDGEAVIALAEALEALKGARL